MPLGVEQLKEVGEQALDEMIPKPLMPLGVEQGSILILCRPCLIPKPLMPLGVEQSLKASIKSSLLGIPKPLMPLGVEQDLKDWMIANKTNS